MPADKCFLIKPFKEISYFIHWLHLLAFCTSKKVLFKSENLMKMKDIPPQKNAHVHNFLKYNLKVYPLKPYTWGP